MKPENIQSVVSVPNRPLEVVASGAMAQTSAQESQIQLKTQGQRRVNLIWETTQSVIAICVTGQTLYISGQLAAAGNSQPAAFLLLSNAFFLVIGFYFGRTNHQRTGGVGTVDETR